MYRPFSNSAASVSTCDLLQRIPLQRIRSPSTKLTKLTQLTQLTQPNSPKLTKLSDKFIE